MRDGDGRSYAATARFWAAAALQTLLVLYATAPPGIFNASPRSHVAVEAQGQRELARGLMPPRERIKNTLGGVFSQNTTLFFRNSPYFVESDLVFASGTELRIETGVQIYFATGVGLKVSRAAAAAFRQPSRVADLRHDCRHRKFACWRR